MLAALFFLFHRSVLRSATWRATVTPLASIIGSGFLVLAPILIRDFGGNAVYTMAGLCLTAYVLGSAIRWNIAALDESSGLLPLSRTEFVIGRTASVALSFAYIISVCYYLNLLGAFLVSLTPYNSSFNGRLATTASLLLIGAIGWMHGLKGLERSEQVSVGVKLAIIAGLLVGMAWYAGGLARQGALVHNAADPGWNSVRVAFGLLITVQGFETSRYLKEEHSAALRIATMRYSQWISTAIYMIFIGLASIVFSANGIGTQETAIIGMMRDVAPVLPLLLVLAALASQFSAAVADTNGCGGMAQEMTKGKVSSRQAYLIVVAASLVLTWVADIYQIISYASRAFAAYYALQSALALFLNMRARGSVFKSLLFGFLTVFALAILALGIPAE